ncbi:nucleoside hydrolase-like domain-containing protein [Flavobacterium rhizosphaerae]|uniref:Nucleoside hydrolase-like domain-containing protein n=1 Tax=Flavobacterium rhizosphaerae TaxID=3163298 RepID=A0ABW8Z1K4_9FLAO
MKTFKLTVLFLFISGFTSVFSQSLEKNRVVILTDIEADPDDTQSLVRLFIYANQIDIMGLIATTSTHQKNAIHPQSIIKIIEAYGEVQPNLQLHEQGYPKASDLLKLVKKGSELYGMKGVGKGKGTEGSEWIIKVLEDKDERPLWVSVWGGANTLAQALYTIKHTKSKAEAARLVSKLRVYTISDQDDSGIWIRNNFPELFYIVSPGTYGRSTWIAINQVVKGLNNNVISNQWLAENIQQSHGPLGALYPDVMWGMEGDTPAFLHLIPNGLNCPEHPEWGSWGGRYELYKPEFMTDEGSGGVKTEPETRPIWTNASDNYIMYTYNPYGRALKLDEENKLSDNKATILRWREDFQNDFAARMDWCIRPYDKANHPPVPSFKHQEEITVKSGEYFTLDATGTYDPDGDHISYLWFSYPEAGSYKKPLITNVQNSYRANIQAPSVDKIETAHIILKVTDTGTPRLSRYKRLIVTILPK